MAPTMVRASAPTDSNWHDVVSGGTRVKRACLALDAVLQESVASASTSATAQHP